MKDYQKLLLGIIILGVIISAGIFIFTGYFTPIGLGPEQVQMVGDKVNDKMGDIIEASPIGAMTGEKPSEGVPETTKPPAAMNGENLTFYYMDVGQGDSILIGMNGESALVDCGDEE